MFEEYRDEVVSLRRHFHQHPELGFQEVETSKFIRAYLRDLGLAPETVAETGVVACIRGGRPGRTVLLRSDMDALPIQEKNDVPYRSRRPGVMHACGHDGHMAMLLVAAKILAGRRERLCGTVKLVFQPNEEVGGAGRMVEEGVLEHPKVDAAFGVHLWSMIPSGKIGLQSGPVMAEMDIFEIVLTGKGGHTSTPFTSVDPIVCAANLIQAVQAIQTREIDSMKPTVIVFGEIHGGASSNVIADRAVLRGTLRFLYDGGDATEEQPRLRFQRMVSAICEAYRVRCAISFTVSNYTVINDEGSVGFLKERVLSRIVDERAVVPYCTMGGEDFSEFTNRSGTPGALVFIGCGDPRKGSDHPHHCDTFNIDEDVLLTGVKFHVLTALSYLEGGNQ